MKLFALWDEGNSTKIEWYEPAEKKTDASVIIFPGGAYVNLCDYEGKDYAEYLNTLGITAFVVYYRHYPDCFPLPLLDARRAVRFVRANAREFGVAVDKISVMGSSAGGHLCALLSTYINAIDGEGVDELDKIDFIPNAQILCYPVISTDKRIGHLPSYENLLGEEYPNKDNYCPEFLVTEKTPKAFIWHTSNDEIVSMENSCRYAAALSRKGVPSELHIFPFGKHGRALALDDEHVGQWKGLFINWLRLNKLL